MDQFTVRSNKLYSFSWWWRVSSINLLFGRNSTFHLSSERFIQFWPALWGLRCKFLKFIRLPILWMSHQSAFWGIVRSEFRVQPVSGKLTGWFFVTFDIVAYIIEIHPSVHLHHHSSVHMSCNSITGRVSVWEMFTFIRKSFERGNQAFCSRLICWPFNSLMTFFILSSHSLFNSLLPILLDVLDILKGPKEARTKKKSLIR